MIVHECPRCEGRGEVAVEPVPVSPENFETEECWLCHGECIVTAARLAEYEEYLAWREELYFDL